jgi:hypothetical protein
MCVSAVFPNDGPRAPGSEVGRSMLDRLLE